MITSRNEKVPDRVGLSVIIPSYNRPKSLNNTINSLLSGSVIPDEILIVDQSAEPVKIEQKNSVVKVIYSEIPSSTRARNIGLDSAKNDVILFCDDDILVNKDTLNLLWKKMNEKDAALVTTINSKDNSLYSDVKQCLLIKDIISAAVGMKSLFKHRKGRRGYVIQCNMRGRYAYGINKKASTEWAMGFFFCIKKSLAKAWNIEFDENLGRYAYAEDLDFSLRYCAMAQKYHLESNIEPEIYVNHLAAEEWRSPPLEKTFYLIANRKYLSYKIYPEKFWYRLAQNWFDTLYALTQIRDHAYFKQIIRVVIFCNKNRDRVKAGKLQELLEELA